MSNRKKIRPKQSPPFPRVVSSPRIQAVIDEDARFWEANPDVWERTRPYVPGEIKDEHGIEHPPRNGRVRCIRLARDRVSRDPRDGPPQARVDADVPLPPEVAAHLRQMQIAGGRTFPPDHGEPA